MDILGIRSFAGSKINGKKAVVVIEISSTYLKKYQME